MDYADRQRQAKTVPPDLVRDIWSELKGMRDHAVYLVGLEKMREDRLNDLLRRMKDAGMADHLPTIEEVQVAWRDE